MGYVKDNFQNKFITYGSIFSAVATALVLTSCLAVEEPTTQLVQTGNGTAIANAPANSNNGAVCDPFGNPSQQGSELDHGIVAHLRYLTDDQPRYSKASDYLIHAHPVDVTFFHGDLNVPTRSFDRGFTTTTGEVIKNDKGNTLYEYFSMHFESEIRLAAGDNPGKYQFAILSDDGAVLQVDTGTGFRNLINNDGVHPTKMGCNTEGIDFDFMTKMPIKLDYYQGPRYHISLMLLWRELPETGVLDSACGASGNNKFFDYTVFPSQPKPFYNAMLDRGWRPVPAANFFLPASVASNPCASIGAPTTSIVNVSPSATYTNQNSITFELASDTPGATFTCSRDGAPAAACSNPVTYTGLSDGNHNFRAWAEANGKADLTGVSYNWTVDTIMPAVVSSSASPTSSSVTINWVTNKETTTSLFWGLGADTSNQIPDDGVFSTAHSATFSGLAPNTVYSYRMSGYDRVGNLLFTSRFTVRTAP